MNTEGEQGDGVVVPEDFPWNPFPASLAGSQMKFSARQIDGKYVVGLTAAERRERYTVCLDLLDQLSDYTNRKRQQHSDLPLEQLIHQIDVGIRAKGLELGQVEFDWIMRRLRDKFLGT